jgi:hypothetical protein
MSESSSSPFVSLSPWASTSDSCPSKACRSDSWELSACGGARRARGHLLRRSARGRWSKERAIVGWGGACDRRWGHVVHVGGGGEARDRQSSSASMELDRRGTSRPPRRLYTAPREGKCSGGGTARGRRSGTSKLLVRLGARHSAYDGFGDGNIMCNEWHDG